MKKMIAVLVFLLVLCLPHLVLAEENRTVTIDGHTYQVTPGDENATDFENWVWNSEPYTFPYISDEDSIHDYIFNPHSYNLTHNVDSGPAGNRYALGKHDENADYDNAMIVGRIDLDHLYELEKMGYTIVSRVRFDLFWGSGTLEANNDSIYIKYEFPYFYNNDSIANGRIKIKDENTQQWADVYLGSEYDGFNAHTSYYNGNKYYFGDGGSSETKPTAADLGGLMESRHHKDMDFTMQDESYDQYVYHTSEACYLVEYPDGTWDWIYPHNTDIEDDLLAQGYNRWGLKKDHVLFDGENDTIMIWVDELYDSNGRGNYANIYGSDYSGYDHTLAMEFAIFDTREPVPPVVESGSYLSLSGHYNVMANDCPSWAKELSYNGSNHGIIMEIVFDRDVEFDNEYDATTYIPTNMTIGDDGEGSYRFLDYNSGTRKMRFLYETNYGAWARNDSTRYFPPEETPPEYFVTSFDRIEETLIEKMNLRSAESYAMDSGSDTVMQERETGTTMTDDLGCGMRWHNMGSLYNAFVHIDGDPPEIANVEYEIISSDTAPYLNAGDVLQIKVTMADVPSGEAISISHTGYFPFASGARAPYDRFEIAPFVDGLGRTYDRYTIYYKYTVEEDDPNTNFLMHEITGSPPTVPGTGDDTYEQQVYSQAVKMGLRDDYGNVALMQKTGTDRFATLPFPQVKDQYNRQIFVDTTDPSVIFDSSSFDEWKKTQEFELVPYERGSMLENGQFTYIISKDPVHPTKESGVSLAGMDGAFLYPYTRSGTSMTSGYSDISSLKDIQIDNDLYLGTAGYSIYDDRYDPVTRQTVYEGVTYEAGSASDVLFDDRREITGTFYIHTYMKDLAGNESWLTSQPINLDNTPIDSKISPNGTGKYVGDVDIYFNLLQATPSAFSHYQYRWLTPLDMEGLSIDAGDRYAQGTDTYGLCRDASADWHAGEALDSYGKSLIPVPAFATRQHGEHFLLVRGYDAAGTVQHIVSEPFRFDKEAPTVAFESLSGGFDLGLLSHQVQVSVNDADTECVVYKYYFSESNLTRDLSDPIWQELALDLPDLPEDYDMFSGEADESLLVREAVLDTDDWTDPLSGYVFLHIYAEDSAGNGVIEKQEMIVDRGGMPLIRFEYDKAIDQRYKEVVGRAHIGDDGGIASLEYAFSQDPENSGTYASLDMEGVADNRSFDFETDAFDNDGTWYLHIKATDIYGNVTEKVSAAYSISHEDLLASDFAVEPSGLVVSRQASVVYSIEKSEDDGVEYTYSLYSDADHRNLVKRTVSSLKTSWISAPLDTASADVQTFYLTFTNDLGIAADRDLELEAAYDNQSPTAEIVYSPGVEEGITGGEVTATLTNLSDNFSESDSLVANARSHTFTENGTFTFTIEDQAGNAACLVANVGHIVQDRPSVVVHGDQLPGEKNNAIELSFTAVRPTEGGFAQIDSPAIEYQWVAGGGEASGEAWTAYINGEPLAFDEDNLTEGSWDLYTRLTDQGRLIEENQGTYQMDYTAPEAMLTYTFSYVAEEGGEPAFFEGGQEAFDAFGFETIYELAVPITVSIDWEEEEVALKGLEKNGEELPPSESTGFSYNGTAVFTYLDTAGNEGSSQVDISVLDDRASLETAVETSPSAWTKEDVEVTLTAPEGKVFGEVRVDGVPADAVLSDAAAAITLAENGVLSWDLYPAGAEQTPENIYLTETFELTTIDKTPPAGTITTMTVDTYATRADLAVEDELPVEITGVVFTNAQSAEYAFTPGMDQTIGEVTYNGDTHSVTARETGTLVYTFADAAANTGQASVDIVFEGGSLDMSLVSATYSAGGQTYSSLEDLGMTKGPVTVTLSMPESYRVMNNNGFAARTFSVGMAYDFLISNGFAIDKFSVDLGGAIVSDIPQIAAAYTIDGEDYMSMLVNGKTSRDVVVTFQSTDGYDIAQILVDGVPDVQTPFSHTFTENGQVEVQIINELGNSCFMTIGMDWIDKEPVRSGLFSLNTDITRDPAIALRFMATQPVTISEILMDGAHFAAGPAQATDQYEFNVRENGTYKVVYEDNLGNAGFSELVVSNIDRQAPLLKLTYNGEETLRPTNDDVLVEVSLVDPSQEPGGIMVLNTVGNTDGYLFKENGTFTFRVIDVAGNTREITATVDTIDRMPPRFDIEYSTQEPTKENVTATITVGEDDFFIVNEEIGSLPVTVDGREIRVTFSDNGYLPLAIADLAGNERTTLCRVANIDRVEPSIVFTEDYIVAGMGSSPDLSSFYAFDAVDGDISANAVHGTVDTSSAGTKTVSYNVSDRAGNTCTRMREILVLGDAFEVVADGQVRSVPFVVDKGWLSLKLFNFIEKYSVKYLKQPDSGTIKTSAFKTGGNVFEEECDLDFDGEDDVLFTVDRPGWYTIYVQDANRNTREMLIFFSKATGRDEQ